MKRPDRKLNVIIVIYVVVSLILAGLIAYDYYAMTHNIPEVFPHVKQR